MVDAINPQAGQSSSTPPDGGQANQYAGMTPEQIEKIIEQKQAVNAANKALKAELEELRTKHQSASAKLKEIEDKDKSEVEKLQAANREYEAKMAALAAEKAELELHTQALKHGAQDADYASHLLKQARSKNPELDMDAFFAELKTAKPYLFGESKPMPGPKAGNGAPPSQSGNGTSAARVAEIEALLSKMPRTPANETRRMQLISEKIQLQ